MITPFDYQTKAVNACFTALKSFDRIVLDACVGSGKSIIAAMFCDREVKAFGKVLMLVPSQELLAQNKSKLDSILGGSSIVGICSSSAGRRDTSKQITIGTIGTVINQDLTGITLVIIDECHLVNNDEKGQYRELLKRLGCKAIGMTGTPFRGLKAIGLCDSKDSFFQTVAHTISMRAMLARGQIVPLITKQVASVMDGKNFTVKNGEYDEEEQELTVRERMDEVIAAILAVPEKKVMVFAVNVRSCEDITERLGAVATCVHGGTKDRGRRISDFRDGKYKYMVSVNALNTGFDVPNVDALVNVRLIRTPSSYVQTCGRGMRSYPGKFNCAWYDMTDTTKRLGCVEDAGREVKKVKTKKGGGGGGGDTFITCPSCNDIIKPNIYCPSCGEIIELNASVDGLTPEIMSAGWTHTKINVSCYRSSRNNYNIRAYKKGVLVKISSIPTETTSIETILKIGCDQHKEKSYSVALCLERDGAYVPLRFVSKELIKKAEGSSKIDGTFTADLFYKDLSWCLSTGFIIGHGNDQLRMAFFSDKLELDKSKKYSVCAIRCRNTPMHHGRGEFILKSIKLITGN